MTYVMVDVETDGPIPADYSMICLGAVVVDESLDKRFYGQLKPISEQWIPESLKISGFSRNQTQQFDDPKEVMEKFSAWIEVSCAGTPLFISDNNGFDWQFVNYYFHHFLGNKDRKSTRLNSSHLVISYAVFCLKQ